MVRVDIARTFLGVRDLDAFILGTDAIQWRGAGLALRVGGGRALVWPPHTEDVAAALHPINTTEAVRMLRRLATERAR